MSSSSLKPRMSMDSVQAMNLTPCSRAESTRSSRDIAPASFMTFFIMGAPAPAKFILERPRCPVPLGIILPNIACRVLFLSLVSTFSVLRRRLRPQNVKNMVTSSPMAAAPLAMMNAAMARSKSPLNRMMVFLPVVSMSRFLSGYRSVGEVPLVGDLFDLGDPAVLAQAHHPEHDLVAGLTDDLCDLGDGEGAVGERGEDRTPHEQ